MSHTTESKGKLLARVHRIQGQVQAIEKALRMDQDCTEVLQLIASTRGAMNGLMNEVVEGHIRHHVLASRPTRDERKGAEELIAIVRAYFK